MLKSFTRIVVIREPSLKGNNLSLFCSAEMLVRLIKLRFWLERKSLHDQVWLQQQQQQQQIDISPFKSCLRNTIRGRNKASSARMYLMADR